MDMKAARKQLDWARKCRYNAMRWQCESDTPLASQYERIRQAGRES